MRQLAFLFAAAFIMAGCGGSDTTPKSAEKSTEKSTEKSESHDHDHDQDHDHDEDHDHAHEPTRGGTLVELGDHVGNIEFVLDPASGKLTAYCSDAHAENPVRLKNDALKLLIATAAGAPPIEASLTATANPLTGETVGDTSQFEATVEGLKGLTTFEGTLAPLEYRGVQIEATRFTYTASTPK